MFLRWARSNIRETLVMARFIFTRFRPSRRLGAQINFLLSVINLFGATGMVFGTLACLLWHPQVFLAQILFGAELMATIPAPSTPSSIETAMPCGPSPTACSGWPDWPGSARMRWSPQATTTG